jgi:hypothetical protein
MIPTFDKEVLDIIEKIIGIPFISDSYATGAVCFADDEEVRPEFRQSFNTFHVLDYIKAIIHQSNDIEFIEKVSFQIPYPENSTSFWKLVASGIKLRKSDLIDKTRKEAHFEIKWYSKK